MLVSQILGGAGIVFVLYVDQRREKILILILILIPSDRPNTAKFLRYLPPFVKTPTDQRSFFFSGCAILTIIIDIIVPLTTTSYLDE